MRQPFRSAARTTRNSPSFRGSYFSFTRHSLFVAGLLIGLLAMAAPALASHIGPHRTVPSFVWKRLACHYEAVYDPPGPGFFGCTLDLYEPPDGLCASTGGVAGLFNSTACVGWPPGDCTSLPCDISLSDSIESCGSGDPGCQLVEETVTYPPATIAADLQNCVLSEGWCITAPTLHLVGTEPLSGESILLIEGTRNGVAFACSGAVCDVPLLEGNNAFTFWARSSFDDTSEMGSLSAQVDTQGPSVSIPDSWYIWEPVAISVDDEGPSVAQVALTIDGGAYGLRKYTWGNLSLVPDDFIWDRHFGEIVAPIGEYAVTVTATDNLGKVGSAIGEIVIPDPNSPVVSTGGSIGSTSTEGETSGLLGPSPSMEDLLARLPEGDVTEGPAAPIFTGPSTSGSSSASGASGPERTVAGSSSEVTSSAETGTSIEPSTTSAKGSSSGVLWGAAALAAAGAATAYSIARRRAREAQYSEMREAAAGSAATARASRSLSLTSRLQMAVAAAAAAAAAAVKAAQERAELAIRQRNERLRLEREERLEQAERRQALAASQAPASEPPLDLAKLKQQDYAAYEASQRAEALQQHLASERASVPIVAPAPQRSWWQRTVDNVKQTADSAINWVDQHQVELAITLGVVAGVATIILTAGTATPLVVGGLAALAAGGTAAAGAGFGTVGLNAYFNRPLAQNVLRNSALAFVPATLIAGSYALLASGAATTALLNAGGTVTGLCLRFPTACNRLEPLLQGADTIEQVWLSAQLAVQTATKDPRAPETALELQLESMDGGVPGNTAIRELSEIGGDTLEALARHGDEAAELAATVARHSDEVVEVLDHGLVRVHPEAAGTLADELRDTLNTPELIAARGNIEIQVWHSASSGSVYASVPTHEALDALDRLQAIVDSGRTTGNDVDELIETIARASTRGSADRVVLGRFGTTGDYIQEALDKNGVFYDTSDEVFQRLKGMGFDPIDVNQAFLRQQDEAGRVFEYSLRGFTVEEADIEVQAIRELSIGNLNSAREILGLEAGKDFPARIWEASWLLGTGYDPIIDLEGKVILWQR